MGRLPARFGQRNISFRVPFVISGELLLAAGQVGVQFPEATFLHNSDKPFEIHRLIPRLTGFDGEEQPAIIAPLVDPLLLARTIRIRIFDFSKNENLTKNAQLIDSLTKGTAEQTWEWAEPYVLVRSEGFQITVDNVGNADIAPNTRVELTFQGFLLTVQAPSQSR